MNKKLTDTASVVGGFSTESEALSSHDDSELYETPQLVGQRNRAVNSGLREVALTGALFESVSRYGDACAEYLKAYSGIDHETGQRFNRSLREIADYKINPDFEQQNLQQQAGYSAEVVSTARKNARAIMDGRPERTFRSEDVPGLGKNHPIIDTVTMKNGQVISVGQIKFSNKPADVLRKIACGNGGGKNDWSRYMECDRLELPTEQVEEAKKICREQAQEYQKQAEYLRQNGKPELAQQKQAAADNYHKLEKKITDAEVSSDEAKDYRLNPKSATTKDMLGTSHQAGMEGAKVGAVIGCAVSIVSNAVAVYSGEKELEEAIMDTAKSTLVSAGMGYATAATGSLIKSVMQQSSSQVARGLSKTGFPAAVVSSCMSLGKIIYRYAKNEINAEELFHELGISATGLLSASAFTMAGQIAIPIPVLGGLIGGMVGHIITNHFSQGFFAALKETKLSAERRQQLEMQCEAARHLAYQYKKAFENLFSAKVAQLDTESKAMFSLLENPCVSADELCAGMNRFLAVLGKQSHINSMADLERMMLDDAPLKI